MLCISAAYAVMRCLCVCVCLSRSCTVSKQIKISSNFFHRQVATPFSFSTRNGMHQMITSLHIACPKELEAASRSSKTYLAKNSGGRSAPI